MPQPPLEPPAVDQGNKVAGAFERCGIVIIVRKSTWVVFQFFQRAQRGLKVLNGIFLCDKSQVHRGDNAHQINTDIRHIGVVAYKGPFAKRNLAKFRPTSLRMSMRAS